MILTTRGAIDIFIDLDTRSWCFVYFFEAKTFLSIWRIVSWHILADRFLV